MAKRWLNQSLDIVRLDKVAATERRERLRCMEESE
jgi:hypothetical protein